MRVGVEREFDERRRLVAQNDRNLLELFEYIVSRGNGYTSDYSVPESICATSPLRAGYKWLRKNMAARLPHMCA